MKSVRDVWRGTLTTYFWRRPISRYKLITTFVGIRLDGGVGKPDVEHQVDSSVCTGV